MRSSLWTASSASRVVSPPLVADQLGWCGQRHGGLQHVEGHGFGDRVHDTDTQHALAPRVVASAQCVLQGIPQGEYFGRITSHQAACIRGFESAPGLAQQRLANARLKLLDLAAQGLRRQVQLFAGPHKATGT